MRNALLQASLAQLKANGYYERYTGLIAPEMLEQLLSSLAPVEEWGLRLNAYEYYSQGHVAALRSTYEALGTRITQLKVVSYAAPRDELVVSVRWL